MIDGAGDGDPCATSVSVERSVSAAKAMCAMRGSQRSDVITQEQRDDMRGMPAAGMVEDKRGEGEGSDDSTTGSVAHEKKKYCATRVATTTAVVVVTRTAPGRTTTVTRTVTA